MTPNEWKAEVNRLMAETFNIGQREWRVFDLESEGWLTPWVSTDYHCRSRQEWQNDPRYEVRWRFQPLDCCSSLDLVRGAERALRAEQDRAVWLEELREVLGVPAGASPSNQAAVVLAPAWARAEALLRWKKVEVPQRPAGVIL